MGRQEELQAFLDERLARPERGGKENKLYLVGCLDNGIAIKEPRGTAGAIGRTLERHEHIKDVAGELAIPFELAGPLELNVGQFNTPASMRTQRRVHTPIVQQQIAHGDVIHQRLQEACKQGDIEAIKELLENVIEFRRKLLQLGILFIDPLPTNMALVDGDMKLLDISSADVCSRDFIIAVNRTFLMNRLGPHINIFAYRMELTRKVVKALGNDWDAFRAGMSDFHNPAFLENALPSRRDIRDRSKRKGKNGKGKTRVPDVRFSLED